jgi:hypothetical protein
VGGVIALLALVRCFSMCLDVDKFVGSSGVDQAEEMLTSIQHRDCYMMSALSKTDKCICICGL